MTNNQILSTLFLSLPRSLPDSRDKSHQRHFTKRDTRKPECRHVATGPPGHRAPVAHALGRRVARQLLQSRLRRELLRVGGLRIAHDGLEGLPLGRVLQRHPLAALVLLDAALFRHRGLVVAVDVAAVCRLPSASYWFAFTTIGLSSPRNGIPSSRSSANAWSSLVVVVANVMSMPWICSTWS